MGTKKQRRLQDENARFYRAEMCLAFNHLYERDITNRYLKLDDNLLDNEGHTKVTDYKTCKEGIGTGDA